MLNEFQQVQDLATYYENFKKVLSFVVLLDKMYSLVSNIEDIDHDCIESFLRADLNDQYNSFEEVYNAINQHCLS